MMRLTRRALGACATRKPAHEVEVAPVCQRRQAVRLLRGGVVYGERAAGAGVQAWEDLGDVWGGAGLAAEAHACRSRSYASLRSIVINGGLLCLERLPTLDALRAPLAVVPF